MNERFVEDAWQHVEDDSNDFEDAQIPMCIASQHGEVFVDILEHLEARGKIERHDRVKGLSLEIDVHEGVWVTDVEECTEEI